MLRECNLVRTCLLEYEDAHRPIPPCHLQLLYARVRGGLLELARPHARHLSRDENLPSEHA